MIVPDDQLSLAIGREGQNARLAARLTGWRVDIRSETEFAAEEAEHGYEEEEAAGPLRGDPLQRHGAARTPRCRARATAACGAPGAHRHRQRLRDRRAAGGRRSRVADELARTRSVADGRADGARAGAGGPVAEPARAEPAGLAAEVPHGQEARPRNSQGEGDPLEGGDRQAPGCRSRTSRRPPPASTRRDIELGVQRRQEGARPRTARQRGRGGARRRAPAPAGQRQAAPHRAGAAAAEAHRAAGTAPPGSGRAPRQARRRGRGARARPTRDSRTASARPALAPVDAVAASSSTRRPRAARRAAAAPAADAAAPPRSPPPRTVGRADFSQQRGEAAGGTDVTEINSGCDRQGGRRVARRLRRPT